MKIKVLLFSVCKALALHREKFIFPLKKFFCIFTLGIHNGRYEKPSAFGIPLRKFYFHEESFPQAYGPLSSAPQVSVYSFLFAQMHTLTDMVPKIDLRFTKFLRNYLRYSFGKLRFTQLSPRVTQFFTDTPCSEGNFAKLFNNLPQ